MVAIQCKKVALPYEEFLGLGEGIFLCMSWVIGIHRMQGRCQASMSFTLSWSLLKLMSIESVMPSKPSHPLFIPFYFCT